MFRSNEERQRETHYRGMSFQEERKYIIDSESFVSTYETLIDKYVTLVDPRERRWKGETEGR